MIDSMDLFDALFLLQLLKPVPQKTFAYLLGLEKIKKTLCETRWQIETLSVVNDLNVAWSLLQSHSRYQDFTKELIDDYGITCGEDMKTLVFEQVVLLALTLKATGRNKFLRIVQIYL
jgi:hypothetical protein